MLHTFRLRLARTLCPIKRPAVYPGTIHPRRTLDAIEAADRRFARAMWRTALALALMAWATCYVVSLRQQVTHLRHECWTLAVAGGQNTRPYKDR